VHGAREPSCERLTKAFEAGGGRSEQAGAVVGVVERDDAALAGASNAVRSAISTASAPVTPSFEGHGKVCRSSAVTAASAMPSACATGAEEIADITRGLR
jgi:hypothetical protein